jgi:diguanylate cyclase (GGDEF)-like protein
MSLLELFTGVNGEFIKIVLIVPIAVLMWLLSLQLHTKRKRKSYTHLSTISLGYLFFNIISFLSLFVAGLAGLEATWLVNSINAISNTAFLLFLYGFYRIHNKVDIKMYLIFLAPASLTLILGLISNWIGCIIGMASVLAITFFFGNKIGRRKKIWIASGIFTFSLVSSIAADLIPGISGGANMVASLAAPAALTVLFVSLMDHSLLIMQSSYVSAITDPLTGLFNRRYFTKYITKCIERNVPVHVIFSDIDNFKKLNDTKGHKIGDEVLKQVASIFMEEVEGLGIAGRYGGEEMVALIQNPDVDMAELTERIRSRIEKESIATASIGYKIFESGLPPEMLIKQADEAMYIAKQSGKNRVVRYGAAPESVSNKNSEDLQAASNG